MAEELRHTLYLVTGAAGFLGGTVCRQLLERGDAVRAFILPNDPAKQYVPEEAELAEGEYTTLGGWLFERLASVPAQGAVVDVPELGLQMKIEKMDGHRIDSVLVSRMEPPPAEGDAG